MKPKKPKVKICKAWAVVDEDGMSYTCHEYFLDQAAIFKSKRCAEYAIESHFFNKEERESMKIVRIEMSFKS